MRVGLSKILLLLSVSLMAKNVFAMIPSMPGFCGQVFTEKMTKEQKKQIEYLKKDVDFLFHMQFKGANVSKTKTSSEVQSKTWYRLSFDEKIAKLEAHIPGEGNNIHNVSPSLSRTKFSQAFANFYFFLLENQGKSTVEMAKLPLEIESIQSGYGVYPSTLISRDSLQKFKDYVLSQRDLVVEASVSLKDRSDVPFLLKPSTLVSQVRFIEKMEELFFLEPSLTGVSFAISQKSIRMMSELGEKSKDVYGLPVKKFLNRVTYSTDSLLDKPYLKHQASFEILLKDPKFVELAESFLERYSLPERFLHDRLSDWLFNKKQVLMGRKPLSNLGRYIVTYQELNNIETSVEAFLQNITGAISFSNAFNWRFSSGSSARVNSHFRTFLEREGYGNQEILDSAGIVLRSAFGYEHSLKSLEWNLADPR